MSRLGLPAQVPLPGEPGAAVPVIITAGRELGLSTVMIDSLLRLAQNESRCTPYRPAGTFKLVGDPLITAFGVFQFNKGATQRATGVRELWPWGLYESTEVTGARPPHPSKFLEVLSVGMEVRYVMRHYGQLAREAPVPEQLRRFVPHVHHMGPAFFEAWLEGLRVGEDAAWTRLDSQPGKLAGQRTAKIHRRFVSRSAV